VGRTMEALAATGQRTLAVVGGVAANGALRDAFADACARGGIELALAPLSLCSDNAAMIASAARFTDPIAYPAYLDLDAHSSRVA
jgi:N6-L-threonylcarbamoyladenine synthase